MTSVVDSPSVLPLEPVPAIAVDPAQWEEWESQLKESYVSAKVSNHTNIKVGSNTFTDCHVEEMVVWHCSASGLPTITAPTAAQVSTYEVTFTGTYSIVHLGSNKPAGPRVPAHRLDSAVEVTPQLLCRAADYIERVGMLQGDLWPGARADYYTPSGMNQPYRPGAPVCAWGAVLVMAGFVDVVPDITIDEYLWDAHRVLNGLAPFNDAPERTTRQVSAELRRRAQVLQAVIDARAETSAVA